MRSSGYWQRSAVIGQRGSSVLVHEQQVLEFAD